MAYSGHKTKLKLADIANMPNVAQKLTQEELTYYGRMAVEGYNVDVASRMPWVQRTANAQKVVLQMVEKKSFPWENASNVKFPLVTIAALQFLARISILTKGRSIAKLQVWGADPEGHRNMAAERISSHMNYQLVAEDNGWFEDDESAKLSAAIMGCAIKKSFYDGVEGITRSEHVPLMNFVVDYYCKDLSKAQRISHKLEWFENDIEEQVTRGLCLPMTDNIPASSPTSTDSDLLKTTADQIAGVTDQLSDSLRPYSIIEQHCWLDLDDDGYAEPYVMFVRLDTAQVLRIAARFYDAGDVFRKNDNTIRQLKRQQDNSTDTPERMRLEKELMKLEADNPVIRILPTQHFTRYLFIPSPDQGFYGLGLGAILGPTNAAVDTLINQMIDSGTMLTTSGGFLGRGVKIKSGKQSFDPFEWKPVDGSGDDLRKNIVPLPVNAPSEVLFHLLGLLISYGEKIGSATDVMTGVNPGQNTPAETSRNTLEQGMMLFSGVYNRMYRAFAHELQLRYHLNCLYLKQAANWLDLTEGPAALIMPTDYDDTKMLIMPAADPVAVSSTQKLQKAKMVFEVMQATPNGFDRYQVIKQFLDAMEVVGVEQLFPDPKGKHAIAPLPNPKVELEKAKLQQGAKEHQENLQVTVAQLQLDAAVGQAKIAELEAKALKETAEAQGVKTGHAIALIEAQIGAAKAHQEGVLKSLDLLTRALTSDQQHLLDKAKLSQGTGNANKQSGMAGMGAAPADSGV